MFVTITAFILWYRWDSGTNHGLSFGYFGQYNAVSNALSKIPAVTIVDTGYNADVTLEEFGFDIKTSSGSVLHIWLNEDDPIRRMSAGQIKHALETKITAMLATNQTK